MWKIIFPTAPLFLHPIINTIFIPLLTILIFHGVIPIFIVYITVIIILPPALHLTLTLEPIVLQ
jgi:hypothetical protein